MYSNPVMLQAVKLTRDFCRYGFRIVDRLPVESRDRFSLMRSLNINSPGVESTRNSVRLIWSPTHLKKTVCMLLGMTQLI